MRFAQRKDEPGDQASLYRSVQAIPGTRPAKASGLCRPRHQVTDNGVVSIKVIGVSSDLFGFRTNPGWQALAFARRLVPSARV